MKAVEQYFHLVLFIMVYKVVLAFKSVDKTLLCDHSNESYWAVLPCGTVFMFYKVLLTFWLDKALVYKKMKRVSP